MRMKKLLDRKEGDGVRPSCQEALFIKGIKGTLMKNNILKNNNIMINNKLSLKEKVTFRNIYNQTNLKNL